MIRNFVLVLLVVLLAMSCGNNKQGQLIGVSGKDWFPERPYGMVLIDGGAFTMGSADDDIAGLKNAPPKSVTVTSYYMDETEITNSEYRQFVEEVRDSVVRQKLAEAAELAGSGNGDENDNGRSIQDFAFKDAQQGENADGDNEEDQTPFQKYSKLYDPLQRKLNKDIDLIWEPSEFPDEDYVMVMDEFYLPKEQSYNGESMLDVTKFKYNYKTMDVEAAARDQGDRTDYIKEREVAVYPDTTVWIRDFNYSYNEPMHNDYFSHSAYDNYPVVGVNWKQAKAFCNWRTKLLNDFKRRKQEELVNNFRLPTEAEWEYAASGGLKSPKYPWGNPNTIDDRGCYLANFKPLRGDYAADNALYTVEADSYKPNGFGLYNMSGNVSEWVDTSFNQSSYEFMSSMNPNVNNIDNLRKVIRGGSWKDVGLLLRVSARNFEYADSARSYIGFRTVQNYLGNTTQNTFRN